MTCVVQYENANPNKKQAGYYYAVPYFDLSGPDVPEGKMLFQWAIEGSATLYPGKLTFAIQFYRTSEVEYDDEQGKPVKYYRYDYLLNTLPNFTTVQHGMDTAAFIENYESPAEPIKAIFDEINAVNQQLKKGWKL